MAKSRIQVIGGLVSESSFSAGTPACGEGCLPGNCQGDRKSVQGGRVSAHHPREGRVGDLFWQVPGALQGDSAKDHETGAWGGDNAPGVRVHA